MKIDAEKTNAAQRRHEEGVSLLNGYFNYDGSGVPLRLRNKPRTHSKRMRAARAR